MLWQMCLMLWLLTWLPGFRRFWSRPLLASFAVFAVGVVLAREFPRPDLVNRLPWLYLWDFSLGLIVFFALKLKDERQRALIKPVILLCTVVGGYVGWGIHRMPMYWLSAAMVAFLYVDHVVLPRWAAQLVKMLSQATLTIFFAHVAFVHAGKYLIPTHLNVIWLISISASLTIWATLTAGMRAFNHVRKLEQAPTAAIPPSRPLSSGRPAPARVRRRLWDRPQRPASAREAAVLDRAQ
jgi:hypothetical protein